MAQWLWRVVVVLLAFPQAGWADDQPKENWAELGMHMRLVDDLDRPQDGWCLDVVGSGPYIRFDMPLIGHNCKPGLYADEAVMFRDDGTLFFPAYGGCVTAMGLNQHVLPKATLMLKECGKDTPFLNAAQFQKFERGDDQKIRLQGSDLCIHMGDVSEVTFDATHRWRTLFMDKCAGDHDALSQWKFVKPG